MNSRPLPRLLYLVFALVWGVQPLVTHAAPSDAPVLSGLEDLNIERISDFTVNAALTNADQRTLDVRERIKYDFGNSERHGIYRDIPVTYSRNGGTYRLRLHIDEVTRDAESEAYAQSVSDGILDLKIGSPDKTMTGTHVYGIGYSTTRAINFFPDHDELYWNVTGNGWQVPIEKAAFVLTLRSVSSQGVALDLSSVKATCFTGVFGSPEEACTITKRLMDDGLAMINVATSRVLAAGEGLTIVIGLPKGHLLAPTFWDLLWQILSDNGVLFFPLIAFVIMFGVWWVRGRDPRLMTVIPEYEPPENFSPALCGALLTEGNVPSRTVTATIIDLARRGYLKINIEQKKGLLGLGNSLKYTFIKLKEEDVDMVDYEKSLFTGLFSKGDAVKLEDLQKNQFYASVSSFKKDVQRVVDARGVFVTNPAAVRGAFIAAAIVIAWGMFFFFGDSGLGVISAMLTGGIMIVFGMIMPRRTESGNKLLAGMKGFKWFLSVTEKDRLDFHNAPERTPAQFMKFLPYAIAFEVEKKWAEQFASMDIPPPSWATGSGIHNMNALLFVSAMDSMHSAASSGGYSAPSSAGSGSSGFSGGGSGGGFGGGGGGSW